MVFDICEVACPNRYNEKGVYEQPVYGDTDSLVFRDWQANLLVQAGWIEKTNGKLTDELADTNAHWFLPKSLSPIIDCVDTFFEMPFCEVDKSLKGMAAQ